MKTYLYTTSYTGILHAAKHYRKAVLIFFLLSVAVLTMGQSGPGGGSNSGNGNGSNRELKFSNARLETGNAGSNGAIYRFPQVNNNVDALVKIAGRSDSRVRLISIDLTNTGHQKAFQPQVTFNNGSTSGTQDWWMEFEITFVNKDGVTPVDVADFDVTALDIDGDGGRLREYVTFYQQKSFRLEGNSLLSVTNILQSILGILTPGKQFTGPASNFNNIDTSATQLMVTNHFESTNRFRVRTGGRTSGSTSNTERMYSMYFKSFSYDAPIEFTLPLVLTAFNATLGTEKVALSWETGMEKELSHFVVERSIDGSDYKEAGVVFASGNSAVKLQYTFTDKVVSSPKGIVYYRLKMVDVDQKYQHSAIRVIRTNETMAVVNMQAYPNPAVNELRITVPLAWQNKNVNYQVYNTNGQLVKQVINPAASQTETIDVKDLGAGLYVVKASTATESATQRIIKK